MGKALYPIESVARSLGQRARARVNLLRDAVSPPGQRPPFTVQQTGADAVAWWRQHRYDATGAQVLARYTPAQIVQLDAELNSVVSAEQPGGSPDVGAGPPVGGGQIPST